ncbi:MAG: Ku protein, partial [Bradyrhizobium sp.]
MPEAVWNGFLRLSLVSCPVGLARATTHAHSIRLDQLNSRTGNPVAEQFVDSRTGDVVSPDAVIKGFPTATGYVAISDSEAAALAGEA